MKNSQRLAAAIGVFLVAGVAWAGEPPVHSVPTLGELGLVILGLSLIGGGAVAMRRRRP